MSASTQINPLVAFAALLISMLSACSNQQTINSFTAETAPSNQVAVYVYRPLSTTNAVYSPDLYVNDEFKYSIKSGKKARLLLDAGNTIFEIEPDKNYTGVTRITTTLNPDDTYFLRIDTSLKIKNTTSYEPYERSFSLIEVADQQAIEEISQCCHSGSSSNTGDDNKTDSNPSADETDKSDNGFSVDKTQNPFSH